MIIHTISLKGKRDKNEDEIDIFDNINQQHQDYNKGFYASIFDGHGGDKIAKLLKNKYKLYDYFLHINSTKKLNNTKEFNTYIVKLFELIQNKLINDEVAANKMGSTCLITLLYEKNNDNYLKIINLGDCRSIFCNNYNIAIPLSKDHKPAQFEEKKRIEKEGGTIIYEIGDDPRISGLSVSRCFGDLDCKYISQVPDVFDYKLHNIKFIIMACDGVWDVLSNQDVVDFVCYELCNQKLTKNLATKNNNNIAYLLGLYALDKGSTDNLSIIIIFL